MTVIYRENDRRLDESGQRRINCWERFRLTDVCKITAQRSADVKTVEVVKPGRAEVLSAEKKEGTGGR